MTDVNEDLKKLMLTLLDYETKMGRDNYAEGSVLSKMSALSPEELSDAVDLLESNGFLSVQRYLGTHPYTFGEIAFTARGRASAKDLKNQLAAQSVQAKMVAEKYTRDQTEEAPIAKLNLFPTGSPFGFNDDDWDTVKLRRDEINKLIVVFGHQWSSKYFDSEKLRNSIEVMFQKSIDGLDKDKFPSIILEYHPLQGGYGGHVFNQIARDIISADIAVFDVSDHNPNVMIELGVALTWGVRTLPIMDITSPHLPSDISGIHWAKYTDNGLTWTDSEHYKKLQVMVASAIANKPRKERYPGA